MGEVITRGPEARKKVIEILESGGNLDDAARETGFGRDYCRQLGAKAGFRFWKDKPKATKNEKYTEIAKLYKRGYEPRQVADKLGYKSVTSVHIALRACGVPIRKKISLSVYEFRICPQCNSVFYCHENHNQRFCSKDCERMHTWKKYGPARRARKQNAVVDKDITLKKVARRDKDVCYLCGGIVDWNDYKLVNGRKSVLGRYPSIDHVVPLCQGGRHSWENVRLAHISCNSSKGGRMIG